MVKKKKKLVSAVKKIDKDHSVKIAFSSIVNRDDQDFKGKINDVNNKLRNICNSAGIGFNDNLNLETTVTQQVRILMTIQILMAHA